MSDITLTASQRSTLLSLTQTSALSDRTQERLNTGKKVNTAADDATAFFQAASLDNRASDISNRKSTTDQSIQALNAALTATSAVSTLLTQLKGIIDSAKTAKGSSAKADTIQFKSVGSQLAQLVKDASYQGLNLLTSSNAKLSTQFSERTAATFSVTGFNLISTGAGTDNTLFTGGAAFKASGTGYALVMSNLFGGASIGGFSQLTGTGTAASGAGILNATASASFFTKIENTIDKAIGKIQAFTAQLGTNVTILQTRANFASNYSNTLTNGSDALTLADLNAEAANSSSLTLRQSLGIQSLSIQNTANQSILNLLK